MASYPSSVSIYEVSPRDGLQNERKSLPVGSKKLLIQGLVGAGLRRVEVTSYVSPQWVPQLADAGELTQDIARMDGVRFSALCPNTRGLERAVDAGIEEVAVFLSASPTHNLKNTNRSIKRSLDVFAELVPLALAHGMRVRAYISTVWGCPYEGKVDLGRVVEVAQALEQLGCYQVSFGDTIGVGTPSQTSAICKRLLDRFDAEKIALHLHDTRGTALANALIGLQHGIRDFDTSIAGIGGCPYAPGAAGNLATEDLVYMLEGMNIETGIHLPALMEVGTLAEQLLGRELPGRLHRAGLPRVR